MLASACAPHTRIASSPRAPLALAESLFAETRFDRDAIGIAEARGVDRAANGQPIAEVGRRYAEHRAMLDSALTTVDGADLGAGDAEAIGAMRRVARELPATLDVTRADTARVEPPHCDYDVDSLERAANPRQALSRAAYACYGWAVQNIRVGDRTLDRLSVLGTLPQISSEDERRRLFLAMAPMWATMNGDDGPRSPYRHLIRHSAAQWRAGNSPVAANLRALGVDPDTAAHWLELVLGRWRDLTPDTLIEPWNWHWSAGAASRALAARIPRERLAEINERYFAALGASPAALHVEYDLEPRAGKTPVAFTDFGERGGMRGGVWHPTVPWVFATYRVGGLDNLNELLHETGHAVHIAAIRTRPAFLDWPDSDPFTEGLGDMLALEVFEPRWQIRWLGDSASLGESLRAKYAAVMLDFAWSLFELRMHELPSADPNVTWASITHDYLHIAAHPELSWWAMRGQLIESPGYMMNYAIGAIIIADIRARVRAVHGPFTEGDSSWYPWMSAQLYRFGAERSSRGVTRAFLGRAVSPAALVADMERMRR